MNRLQWEPCVFHAKPSAYQTAVPFLSSIFANKLMSGAEWLSEGTYVQKPACKHKLSPHRRAPA